MKKEDQNIEYKESWRDEYIKWICGFANADGGKIYIGVNDARTVVGITDATKLLEDLPNKVRDLLGIIVDVNLKTEKNKEYIEICVDPYPYPVNYKGQYHYRTGSTKQELKGPALSHFLLQKQGKRWDGVPIPGVKLSDLKEETFKQFKGKATESKRVSADILKDGNNQLIDDLHLREGKFLKRAAVLLFHPEPEKYVTGSFIKIGFFEGDDDLKYQDEIHGNIFEQIEKTSQLLFSKYIKANITYKGVNRIETYEYPEEAIREALLNAIAHKDYASENPIQISVYDDKISFWNEGSLPENWTIDSLTRKHPSKPFNPDIANALSRSGYIEAWGRGTIKMIQECKKIKLPAPSFNYHNSGFVVEFRKDIYTREILEDKKFSSEQIEILLFTKKQGSINNTNVQELCSVSKRTATRYLNELEALGHLTKSGETGKGTSYLLKGPQRGQNVLKGAKIEPKTSDSKAYAELRPRRIVNVRKTSETSETSENTKDATNTPKPPVKIQRGHKGAKTTLKGPKQELSLDDQLTILKKQMAKTASGKEIKTHFNPDVFFEMYDSWMKETLKKLISVGQKFNDFYTKPQHYMMMLNGGMATHFSNQKPDDILKTFITNTREKNLNIHSGVKLTLAFNYTTFKKVNKKRETFGCIYHFEIEFDFTEYRVSLDQFWEKEQRNPQPYFGGLLHEPLPIKIVNKLEKDLGDNLLKHITYHTQNMGIL